MTAYQKFIAKKKLINVPTGLDEVPKLSPMLYDFQRDLVGWALRRGRAALFCDCGLGKGQPYGSMILTADGFIPNNELEVGDMIVASDGKFYPLQKIHHRGEQQTFRIHFSDKSSFIVDSDHLHIVRTNNDRQRGCDWRVMSTTDLLSTNLRYGSSGKSRNYDIPVVAPIQFEKQNHWIHPYVLGVILGDGCITKNCTISSNDQYVVDKVRLLLPDGWTLTLKPDTKYDYKISKNGCNDRTFIQELRRLGIYGRNSKTKFIPNEYLYDSIENRLDLLQGLMDTDGYIRDSSQYYSTSALLADDTMFLVRSLGGVPTRTTKKTSCMHNGTMRSGAICHVITFSLKTFNPFSLPRKASLWNDSPRDNGRWIDRIEKLDIQKTICLSVGSPDQSYVTENLIVTHNTPMQLEWAKHVPGNVLILAPLAVSMQTVAEGRKFGVEVNYCRNQTEVLDGVTITNYEMLDHFDPAYFNGIVLDECFPPETPIDVFSIDNVLTCRYIKDVRKGDRIFNASGEDHVQNIYKRRIDRAVKISINGHNVTCSENHPWFTVHGWRSAQDLRTGDNVMATSEAVRLVRGGVQAEARSSENAKVLRSILLSEMAHEHTGAQGKGSHARSGSEEGRSPFQMVEEWEPTIDCRNGAYNQPQPNGQPIDEGEAIIDIAEDGSQTFRAWGQWTSDDITSAINDGCVVRQLDTGICYITGETSTRFSDMLQSRLRESRLENSDRVGRSYASDTEGEGRKEGCETGFFRVDSVEILELGHHDLEQYRDENGDIYFYDIKASRHPSFSVNGCLVHNSSILKSFTGKIRNNIINSFRNTPFRLACTATPAPNDYMELGNHAEFLGVMNRTEMLAMFFVHDGGETSKWRLKGHAEEPFWKWICGWAMNVRKPSDIGYDDTTFILPPMEMHSHVVKKDKPDDMLFNVDAMTLQERQRERKATTEIRAKECARIVAQHPDKQWLVWCNLNDESATLTKMIPGAIEVKGSDSIEHKEKSLLGFAAGEIRVLVSKPKIAGMGLNLQQCHKMAFVGLSDSYEQFYQAARRCWRFGQKNPVDIHVITAETEGAVVRNIQRKEDDAMRMAENMLQHMKTIEIENIKPIEKSGNEYAPNQKMVLPAWLNA